MENTVRTAQRIANLPPYLFAEIDRKKEAKQAQGIDVISLGIGDPDTPTPDNIVDAMAQAIRNPANHQYPSYYGAKRYRQACAEWMDTRFGVHVDPDDEVVALIGSKEGIAHIFLGYDHLLFLLALIVVSRFIELVKVVTAFTVAHTITLILAALQIVSLPARLIECGVALTIVYVAAENLWTKRTSHRWMLTFAFGLVHGFSFANVLRTLGLPATGLARSLLCFNLGVEIGQICIVAALWPLIWWLNRQPWDRRAKVGVSIAILLCGAVWFVERAFRLKLMPV